MSVIVITGQPGAGKTALCVDMLANDPQFEGRPLFVMGIPDLVLEHTPCPPVAEWTVHRQSPEDESVSLVYFTFPENALVVIDEAQRIYRPRPAGSKVPPEVSAFETHRHTGVDFILLTQHAGLIDSNIRKLVGRHVHIRVTPLGRYKYEWTELGDPDSVSSRDIAAKERYKLPARSFDLYKSSQKHTKIKTKMPWFVYVFGIAGVVTIGLGVYVYHRVSEKIKPPEILNTGVKQNSSTSSGQHDTAAQFYVSLHPRIKGLQHTSPRYDEITKPVDAPWPVGCLSKFDSEAKKKTCRCIDQQGNNYHTEIDVCLGIVKNGIFKDWQGKEPPQQQQQQHQHQQLDRKDDRQMARPVGVQSPLSVVTQAPVAMSEPFDDISPRVPESSPWRFKQKS